MLSRSMSSGFVVMALTIATSASAVKMQPGWHNVTLSDGQTLTLRAFGDQDLAWFETTDGVLLCQQGTDFFVATVDDRGVLHASQVLAHNSNNRSDIEMEMIANQNRKAFFDHCQTAKADNRMRREPLPYSSTLLPAQGDVKVPVILVQFTDTVFSFDDPHSVFTEYLNGETRHGEDESLTIGNNYSSVKNYFSDMSFGKFVPDFHLYGPITLPQPLAYYGKGSATSENMRALLQDAVSAVDSEVDFSQYDSNGDGNIDLIYIIYAGYSQSIVGNSTDCIHPKSGTVGGGITADGVTVCRYGVNNELNLTPAHTAQYGPLVNGIGLFCHEFSHCIGLSDLYALHGSKAERAVNQTMEYYDLMDAGEYTFNGYRPTAYTAWERERFGWMTIDTLSSPQDVTLTPLDNGGKAYRILNDADSTGHEYFILENIQKKGWNKSIFGHGLMVTHVDYDDNNFDLYGCKVNSTLAHPRMTLVPADGLLMTEYFINATIAIDADNGVAEWNTPLYDRYLGQTITSNMYKADAANDLFPGNTVSVTELGDRAWLYTGGVLDKTVTDIAETDGVITFKFMGGAPSDIHDIRQEANISGDDNVSAVTVYSLDGRRVAMQGQWSSLKPGFYIINGKKVVR